MTDSSIPPEPEFDLFLGDVEDMTFGETRVEDTNGVPDLEIIDVTPEDITEGMPEEETIKIGDGSCIVCGTPTFRPPGLTPTGRPKRAPKYCDLHNPKLRIQKERSFTPGVEGVAVLQKVQAELADDLRLLAVMTGPLLPVTGLYVFDNADPFTAALLKLCKNNPRALRVLHRAATVAPIYEVAKDAAGVFYAIQVDMKKLDPNTTVSQRLGVRDAYFKVYPEDQSNTVNNGSMQGPPRYATTQ